LHQSQNFDLKEQVAHIDQMLADAARSRIQVDQLLADAARSGTQIDQMNADAARKRQEMRLVRGQHWLSKLRGNARRHARAGAGVPGGARRGTVAASLAAA
jgi:hypothetical protein